MDGYVRKPFDLQDLAGALRVHGVPEETAQPEARSSSAPQSSGSSQAEAFRPSALDEISALYPPGEGAQFVSQVVDSYVAETTKLLEQLSEGVDDGSPEPVQRLAHAIKSSSAQVGAARMSELAARLESEAREQDLSYAEAHLDALGHAFAEACEAIRAHLDDMDPDAAGGRGDSIVAHSPNRGSDS